jgi:MFS family permease
MGKKEKNIYQALSIIIFSISLGFCIVNPFLPIYVQNKGANGLSIALIFSGYSIAKILFQPLSGIWYDRRSKPLFICLGLGVYTLISVCYLFMPQRLLLLTLLRFLQGVAAAFVLPLARTIVGQIVPQKREGSFLGTFEVSYYSALTIGPLIGGLIKDRYGFLGLFEALFILCLFSFGIAILAFTHFPNLLPKSNESRVDYKRVFQSRTFGGLIVFILTRAFGIILFTIFLPVLMNNSLKMNSLEIGAVMSFSPALTALLLHPMGQLSDQLDRKLLVFVGGALAAFFTFLLPFAAGFWQLFLLSGGIGLSSSISLPASSALLLEEGRRYGLATTLGFFNSIMETGFLIAPIIGGMIMDNLGEGFVFFMAGLCGTIGVSVFFLLCCPISILKTINNKFRLIFLS